MRVVEKMMGEYSFPDNVELFDGGVTGMMGLLPIIEDADHLIILDAVNGPGEPGALYRYTLEDFKLVMPKKLSIHDVGILECLAIAQTLGKSPTTVTVIGAKPYDISTPAMSLTNVVESKLDDLVVMALAELRALGAEAKAAV